MALGGLALSLAAARADASEPRYRLAISPKPVADALIDLGVQANVSVIGTSACGTGGDVGLSGSFTLDEAVGRLVAQAPCSYRIIDPRTVRIAPAVSARTGDATPPHTLVAELLVTATKRPASVSRLPASVSAIPHDQIELTDAADVVALSGQISGVLTTNLGPARDKLILRGLSDGAFTGRTRSTVGSYLDDAAINYNAPDPDLKLADIERVEVVRGPQGALYGAGSLSGVFRIVSRKPDITAPAFGLAAAAADTKGGSPSRELEGYANLPFLKNVAALRVVGYRETQGGYIDNASLRLSNVDQTVREGGRIAMRVQPDEAWQLDLSAVAQRLRSNDTQYVTPSLGSTARLSRVREGHKNDFAEAAATLHGELGWATLRTSITAVEHNFSSQYDATNAILQRFLAAPSDLGLYLERTRINMISQDTLLRSAGSGRLSWLTGIYAVASIEKSPSTLDIQSGSGALERVYAENRRDRLNEEAIYGEASYDFQSHWNLAMGGRLFSSSIRTQARIVATPPSGVSRVVGQKRHFTGLSPKLSLQRDFARDGVVYALFSEGYRAGGFNTSGFAFPFRPGRTEFVPDRLRNYEIGLKTRTLERRLTMRGAAFYDQWRNIQTDQYRPNGLAYTANVGDADLRGLEAEIGYELGPSLSLQANILLAASKITRANPDFAPQLISGLPSAPRFSGGLLAVYQRPMPRGLTLRMIGETSYVGRSALSFDASKETRMGEYARTKLSAQLAAENWTATVFISNPFDDAGDTFAYGNPFSFGQVRQSTPQRPRTVGVRLTTNY